MDIRRFLWMIALAAACTVTAFNVYVAWRDDARRPPAPDALVPDILLEGISQMNFADDGLQDFRIDAGEAVHFSASGVTEFTQPFLVFYENNDAAWDARADRGLTPDGGQTFRLQGNVVIRRLSPKDATQLNTASIEISAAQETAQTADPVLILQATHRTESEGLHVNMQTGKLTLPRRVISRYQPSS